MTDLTAPNTSLPPSGSGSGSDDAGTSPAASPSASPNAVDAKVTALLELQATPTLMARQVLAQVQEQAFLSSTIKTGVDDAAAGQGLQRSVQAPEAAVNGISFAGQVSLDTNGVLVPANFSLLLEGTHFFSPNVTINGNAAIATSLVGPNDDGLDGALSTASASYALHYAHTDGDAVDVASRSSVTLQSTGSRYSTSRHHLVSGSADRRYTSARDGNLNFAFNVTNKATHVVDTSAAGNALDADGGAVYALTSRVLDGYATVSSSSEQQTANFRLDQVGMGAIPSCLCPTSGAISVVVKEADSSLVYASYNFSSDQCGSPYVYVATATAPKNDADTLAIPYPLSVGDTLLNGSVITAVGVAKLSWDGCTP